jgi:pimeloyl-ACP methyl ester carboxylesterase
MRYVYLHGFASSPLAKKALHLRRAFAMHGIELEVPDLNVPSFRELSVFAMLETVRALEGELSLVGSSLGGWLAARFAELHPDRVARLVLLCPAFELAACWPALLPPGAMETWRRTGALVLPDAEGRPEPIHYAFYEECAREPAYPSVRCPTLIVHGRQDERVPIEGSRAYAAAHPNVELLEVDDVHDLLTSKELIAERTLRFLHIALT